MAARRKPGANIADDARHTVKRTLRLTPAESAALDSVAEARGVNVSRAVGALALAEKSQTAPRIRLTRAQQDAIVVLFEPDQEEQAKLGLDDMFGTSIDATPYALALAEDASKSEAAEAAILEKRGDSRAREARLFSGAMRMLADKIAAAIGDTK